MFGRRTRDEPLDAIDDDSATLDVAYDDRIDDLAPAAGAGGPYDAADAPDDGFARLDLGGIRVPAPTDAELRLDMNDEGQVIAATYVQGRSSLQVSAFAAPRSDGIWADVRDEMLVGIQEAGGSAELADGSFGSELKARVPETPGKKGNLQAARFVGVDGPRWFLRGMFTGPAATDPAAAVQLEGLFRGVIVVRGADAMAPRDQLPLVLPREAQGVLEETPAGPRAMPAPQRGPEITEIQ